MRADLEIDTDQKGPVEQSTYVPVAHPALFYIRLYCTLYHQRIFMSPIKILYHQSTGATPKLKKVQNGQINISSYTENLMAKYVTGNLMAKYVIYIFRFPDSLEIDWNWHQNYRN